MKPAQVNNRKTKRGAWVRVDDATGMVLSEHNGTTAPEAGREGVTVRTGGSGDDWWDGEKFVGLKDFVTEQLLAIEADGIDAAVFVVPAGTVVTGRDIEGRWRDVVDDGLYELTTDIPGPINLQLKKPGYRTMKVRIRAT